ncbi:unnamed protein product [Leptosia nina]|uniref:Uncharacterized protein n=1 Tax=Leptosia nina TaxID=320188 RepID=A0AAV1J1G0_9NEOP
MNRRALLFQSVREGRGQIGIRDREQLILHPRLRRVDDGAASHETPLRPPLLEDRRPYVPLAVGDGVPLDVDSGI